MAKNRILYDRLGVDVDASSTQINEAYDRLIFDCDPSSAEYTEIEEAYTVLSNLDRRAQYDITGKFGDKKGRKKGRTLKSVDKIRKILNTVFMIGAVATIVLYFMKTEERLNTAFFTVGLSSLVIKIVEFILRLLP